MNSKQYHAKIARNYKKRQNVMYKITKLRMRMAPMLARLADYQSELDLLNNQSREIEHEADRYLK